jgi:hypothetical protein
MAANETQIRIAAIDATKQAFQSVNNNLNGLSSSIRTVTGLLTTAFAGFSLGRLVSETADYGKEISRLAQLSGVGVEQFQALSYGAERVGISTEKLADIYKDTQDKVGDFVQTGGGALADFFEQIAPKVGVTAEQFRKLNGADALQLYVSSLQKANLNQSDLIFYLEAIASDSSLLLPLLQNNGKAFNDLAKEAEELGLVLQEDVIAQSREFADNLNRLEKLSGTLGKSIGNALIPALNEIASTLLAINKVSKDEGGLLMTLLKLTEFAELFGVGVTDKVVKAKEQITKSSKEITTALSDITVTGAGPAGNGLKDLNKIIDVQKMKAQQLREIFAKTRSPVDQLSDALWRAQDAYDNLGISTEQYMTMVEQANAAYDATVQKSDRATNALRQYAEAAQDVKRSLQDAAMNGVKRLEDSLVSVFMGTMSVKDAFRNMALSIVEDLIRIQIQRSITGPIADALSGMFRAQGGSVTVGKPYVVGEKGPEMFVPSSSGSIVPNNKMGGGDGGGTVVINQSLNFALGVQQTVRAEVMNMLPQITNAAKSAVADARMRGGSFAGAFR